MVRGLRGASSCAINSAEEINEVTQELLLAMLERNGLRHDDVISGIGFGDVPLLCASEINVPGAMPLTVRVLLHAYTERARSELRHVYLRNTSSLRDDLPA